VSASSHRQDLIRLLTTEGFDSGFAAGHAHVETIMENLASVEASHDAAFRRVIDRLAHSSTGGALIALVARVPSKEIERLVRLRNRFGSVTVVQFDPSAWDPTAPIPTSLAKDGALHVTGARSFADTWNRSMRPARQIRSRAPMRPARPSDNDVADEDRWAAHARIRQ
jgi:hypothetical protein